MTFLRTGARSSNSWLFIKVENIISSLQTQALCLIAGSNCKSCKWQLAFVFQTKGSTPPSSLLIFCPGLFHFLDPLQQLPSQRICSTPHCPRLVSWFYSPTFPCSSICSSSGQNRAFRALQSIPRVSCWLYSCNVHCNIFASASASCQCCRSAIFESVAQNFFPGVPFRIKPSSGPCPINSEASSHKLSVSYADEYQAPDTNDGLEAVNTSAKGFTARSPSLSAAASGMSFVTQVSQQTCSEAIDQLRGKAPAVWSTLCTTRG